MTPGMVNLRTNQKIGRRNVKKIKVSDKLKKRKGILKKRSINLKKVK